MLRQTEHTTSLVFLAGCGRNRSYDRHVVFHVNIDHSKPITHKDSLKPTICLRYCSLSFHVIYDFSHKFSNDAVQPQPRLSYYRPILIHPAVIIGHCYFCLIKLVVFVGFFIDRMILI